MTRGCTMLEGSNAGVEGGEDENGIELSLTLSIGGNYAKAMEQKAFIHPEGPLPKREVQALRRREARKKREEKLKRFFSTEVNGYKGGYAKSNFLDGNVEEKRLQGKLRQRGEEEGGVGVEPARKREKNENCFPGEEIKGLSLSLNLDISSSVPVVPFSRGIVYPCVMPFSAKVAANEGKGKKNSVEPAGFRSFRPHEGKKRDSKESGGNLKPVTDGSHGRGSSAVSDYYRSSSTKGGSCISDTGSNSSHSQPGSSHHKLNSSAASNTAQSGHSDSSDPPMKSNDATNKASTIPHPSPTKPTQDPQKSYTQPIPTAHNHGSLPLTLTQTPYVSTTGNGPNGKTIAGFLYRYTKTEVSIVCVCHGTSFSPAEFVAHAGGVDIEYPLRHITVVSSPAFG